MSAPTRSDQQSPRVIMTVVDGHRWWMEYRSLSVSKGRTGRRPSTRSGTGASSQHVETQGECGHWHRNPGLGFPSTGPGRRDQDGQRPGEACEEGHISVTADTVHLVAHGSPDPRHAASIQRLADRLHALTAVPVTASFLEHDQPRAHDVLLPPVQPHVTRTSELVLPLLLTGGVHWQRDLPPIVGQHGTHRRLLPALAPTVFTSTVTELVLAAGAQDVVLAGAGSTRPAAAQRLADLAAAVAAALPTHHVSVAPTPNGVWAAASLGAVVVPVLVADGIFADRIRSAAAATGATTTNVVGDTWAGARDIAVGVMTAADALLAVVDTSR